MIWGKRDFEGAGYVPYQDRLQGLLFANVTRYQEFIMVATATDRPGTSTYWIGVPSDVLFDRFDGFERVQEVDLPKEINTILVADTTKQPFASRFKFAHRRR